MSEERSSPRAKLSDDPCVSLTVSLYLFPPGSLRNRASLRAVSGCGSILGERKHFTPTRQAMLREIRCTR